VSKPFFYHKRTPGKENRSIYYCLYELSGVFAWITTYLFFTHEFDQAIVLQNSDIGYLLILGTTCTSLAYIAGALVMNEFPAFKVAFIPNLEPVYGIILAFILLGG